MNNREFVDKVRDIVDTTISDDMGYSQAFSDICALVHSEALKPSHNKSTPCSHQHTHVENLTSGSVCDDCGEEL